MARLGNGDFVVCYYCRNEASQAVTVTRDGEVSRRWVCSYHAERLPRKRRRPHWLRKAHSRS
jgi:hypothetical protein